MLTEDEGKRICEEEKAKLEAQERLKNEKKAKGSRVTTYGSLALVATVAVTVAVLSFIHWPQDKNGKTGDTRSSSPVPSQPMTAAIRRGLLLMFVKVKETRQKLEAP